MTTPEQPLSLPPAVDVLGSPQPAARGGGRSTLTAGLVGAGALLVAGSAVAFATFLGGGGPQPEDVLPADAVAMVKLDLDPAAGQKVAVYRLAQRFPSLADRVKDQDEIKDQLLSALLEDVAELDYESDLQPWIGDRIGLAMLPGAEAPTALAAISYTDRAAAERALLEVQSREDDLHFGFSEEADYVLVGASQEVVDSAVAPDRVLSEIASWEEGMDALDGDQIVTAWSDLAAVWAALPAEDRAMAAEMYGLQDDLEVGGTVVAGVHAGDDHVELVGAGVDLRYPVSSAVIGAGEGSDLAQGLPTDTVAAVSVTGLGDGLAELFDSVVGADDPLGLVRGAQEMGLSLPEDLRTLLGEETLLAAFDEAAVGLRTRTDDVDAAYEKAQSLALLLTGGIDPDQSLRRMEDGLAFGSSPEALAAISSTDGGLGETDKFRDALPDADGAGFLGYVDIARALELSGLDVGEYAEDVEQLRSFGVSGSGDEDSNTFRMRLTVRD